MPSPAYVNKDTQHFHYPSPPGSPKESRPRSQTLGALTDTGIQTKKFQDNLVKVKETVVEQEPPKRRNSMTSPMKQM